MSEPPPSTDSRGGLPAWAVRMTSWNIVILIGVAVLWLLIWLCVLFRAAVVPTLLALLGAALLQPLTSWLVARGRSRRFAATTGCALLVVALGGTVWFVSTALVNTATGIARALGNVSAKAGTGSTDELLSSAASGLRNLGSDAIGSVLGGVVQGLALAAQLVTGSVLGFALVFFFLRDGHRFPEFVDAQVGRGPAALVVRSARRAYDALAGFMRGTTIIALIDSVLILIGLLILGVPGAAGLAALVFIGAYVPFVGAFLSGAVAVLVALGDSGWSTALWVLGVVLAVQLIEGNLLQPLIQSRTVSLHPAVVMVAVTAGSAVAGIVGALLAVPLTAAATGVVAELRSALAAAGGEGTAP